MVEALRQLGARITEVDGEGTLARTCWSHRLTLRRRPLGGAGCRLRPGRDRHALCAAAGGAVPAAAVAFDGDPHATAAADGPHHRGAAAGWACSGGRRRARAASPFTHHRHGRVRGGHLVIDASASSQFVSALLLAGARFTEGLHLEHVGKPVPSLDHIAMTVQLLRELGVERGRFRAQPLDGLAGPDPCLRCGR